MCSMSAEDGEESDDEDIEIGGRTQDFRCPLTLKLMENPVTSCVYDRIYPAQPYHASRNVCRHSYNKTEAMEFFGNAPKKCPAAGCNQLVTRNDLFDNEEIVEKIRRQKRRDELEKENEDVQEISDSE